MTIMNIRSFKYHLKEGIKSLFKNRRMSIASIASVGICITMLITSLCFAINLDSALENIEKNIGISIYLGEQATSEQVREIYDNLEAIENVSNIIYMTKEDALNWAIEQWGDDSEILRGLEHDNPFPSSFEIEVSGIENQTEVINQIQKIQKDFEIKYLTNEYINEIELEKSLDISSTEENLEENSILSEEEMSNYISSKINSQDYDFKIIESVKHAQKESDILLSLSKAIRYSSIFLIIILAMISVVIIVNTIKLTVYARREEISIMKYIGATDQFIRWPFIIEGILIGFIGAIIPSIICLLIYIKVSNLIYENLPILTYYADLKPGFELFLGITPFSLLLGIVLGIIGSVNSTKKYLDV